MVEILREIADTAETENPHLARTEIERVHKDLTAMPEQPRHGLSLITKG